jgi:radical SAM superfamily enzyme YgiQ (UPF0313 family)
MLRDSALYRPNPTFRNPPWDSSAFRVLIIRLSPFPDVQRSSPHLFLAREIRRGVPGAFIDMAFLPQAPDRDLFRTNGLPLIIGTQSHRPLSDFTLVLVSNSCLPELVNLPYLLRQSGVPLWAGERGPDLPPIILGGSNSSAAQGILREDGDCMADALFFGEGEGKVAGITAFLASADGPKGGRLQAAADRFEGLWPAGDLSRPVRKSVHDPKDAPEPSFLSPVLPGAEAGTARLPITLGCPCLCSFCFEGHDRKPFRQIPVPAVLAAAHVLKAGCGAETLDVESFNFNTHEGIAELLLGLSGLFLHVNAMSQRTDILAGTPGLLEIEIAAGKRSFTLGIEGISEKQRRFLHKSLPIEDIRRALEALHHRGAREIKLFYILTGSEGDEDFAEFKGFLSWVKEHRRKGNGSPRLIFSFGALVRMPFTPLRYMELLLDERRWGLLAGRIKSICGTNGFEFRLAVPWLDYKVIQVLAMGGLSLHAFLEELAEVEIIYDKRFPPKAGETLNRWLAREENRAKLTGEKPEGHPFPFRFLEGGESGDVLFRRYKDGVAGLDDGYCLRGVPSGCGDCTRCTNVTKVAARPGAAASGKRRAPSAPRRAPSDGAASMSWTAGELADLASRKSRLKPVYAVLKIPREAAGFGAEWLNAYLLRGFLARHPEEAGNILSVRECLVSPWMGPRIPWFGSGVAAFTAWDAGRIGPLLQEDHEAEKPPSDSFISLRLSALFPEDLFPGAERAFLEALRGHHVPFTIERSNDGYGIVVAAKALKKKVIMGGGYARTAEGLRVELLVGRGFRPASLFSDFPDHRSSTRAVVEVTVLPEGH